MKSLYFKFNKLCTPPTTVLFLHTDLTEDDEDTTTIEYLDRQGLRKC